MLIKGIDIQHRILECEYLADTERNFNRIGLTICCQNSSYD